MRKKVQMMMLHDLMLSQKFSLETFSMNIRQLFFQQTKKKEESNVHLTIEKLI